MVEHEEDIAEVLPDLLSGDAAAVGQAVAGLLGMAVGGPVASAAAAGLTKRLITWAEKNSATQKLVCADQAEDLRAERDRATQDVLQWLRTTIVEEISWTEKYEHSQTRLLVAEGNDATHSMLAEIKSRLPAPAPSRASTDEKLNAQLDGTRTLLTDRDPTAALRQLAHIEASGLLVDVSPQVRCRWLNQRGIAHFELGEIPAAIKCLERALDIDPQSLPALTNLSVAYRVSGQAAAAAATSRRATQSHSLEPAAWAVRIECDSDFASSEVPEAVADAIQVRQARAIRAMVDGDLSGATTQLRQLTSGTDPIGELHVLLGKALWAMFEAECNNPSGQDQILEEIVAVLDAGIELIPLTHTSLRQDAHALFGAALRRIGRAADAIAPFTSALELAPGRVDLLLELAQSHIAVGSLTEATRVLRGLNASHETPLSHALLAEISLRTGDKKAAQAHAKLGVGMLSAAELSEGLVRLASVVVDLHDPDLARLIAEHAATDIDNFNARLVLARLAYVKGSESEAIAHYQAALSLTAEPGVAVEYASYLRRGGHFNTALGVLEEFRHRLSDVGAQLYAECALRGGELSRAHEVVEEAWARGNRELWILRVRARIAAARGSTATAITTLAEWVRRAPEDVEPATHLALFCIRAGENSEAEEILRRLRTEYALNAEDCLRVAELHIHSQLTDDARQLAWKGLRLAPHSSSIQHGYLSLYSAFRNTDPVDAVREVAPGVAVRWTDEGGQEHTTLLADEQPVNEDFGEVALESSFARAVLGLGVGATFCLEEGTPYQRSCTIQALMSKASYGFVWVVSRLSANPASAALRTLHIGTSEEAPFAAIERVLKDAEQSIERLLDVYAEHPMPLGILAEAQGKLIVDVYGRIAGSPGRRLFTEFPDLVRRAAAVRACEADAVVVTRSGLTTAVALKLLPLLERLTGNLIAPQALLDDLAQERRRLVEIAAEGRKAVGYVDGRMTIYDTSAHEGKQVLAQHDALTEWIRGNVQILPMPLGVDLPQPDFWDKIGNESSMVARVAVNSKASVYADDLGYRVAIGAIGAEGFSSFALILWAHQRGNLSLDDFRAKMVGLLCLNHSFLPLDSTVLIAAVDESQRKVTPGLRQVVKQLGGSYCELAGAAQVSAVVMRDLRLRELTAGEHDEVLDLLLEAIFSERESSKVQVALTQELRRACRLLPMHLENLLALVDRFLRRRAGASLIHVP